MIFVDTSAFYALYNFKDPHHLSATRIAEKIEKARIPKVSSNIIISETLTLIAMRINKEKALLFDKTFPDMNIQLVLIDQNLHDKALLIFRKIKDKDLSFFDCTSFAVMEALGIKKAFSFDVDFEKYGFELL